MKTPSTNQPNAPPKSTGFQSEIQERISAAIGEELSPAATLRVAERIQGIASEIFTGPLPRPQDLAEYDRVLPGAAERLVRMAEIQQAHAADMERLIIAADIEDQKRGMRFGLLALLLLIGAAAYFAWTGNTVAAGLFLTAGVLGTIPAFIIGRDQRKL